MNLRYSQPVGSEVEGFRCRVHCPGDGGSAKILMNGERRLPLLPPPRHGVKPPALATAFAQVGIHRIAVQ